MIDHFSKTYTEARHRFKEAATSVGATVSSYQLAGDTPNDLTIDVAILGRETDPAVVISSGVHGVEGFFGSAIQLALLKRLPQAWQNLRLVLIHSVNPYGFSQLRRCNEDNIDLNRNFPTSDNDYASAPTGYAELDGLLNPKSPPSRFEPFALKAIWQVLRHGLQPLKAAVAGGQYEYQNGLFFGGSGPSRSTRIVQTNCDGWLASSPRVVHVDFHTGLGRSGTYKVLVNESLKSTCVWYEQAFGRDFVEPLGQSDGTAYPASGLFGDWMQSHFGDRHYRFVCAEFGTYGIIRVLAALRAENRAHHFGAESDPLYHKTKQELLECFCPTDSKWRKSVVEAGLGIIGQACHALSRGIGFEPVEASEDASD